MISDDSIRDELLNLENKINTERPQIDASNLLYHYTDITGLKGIIENNEFWLTRREFMNDAFEEAYAREILKTAYHNVYKNNNSADEMYEKYMIRFFEFSKNYIFSFSIESDSIHQWSYYSNNDGYSIGIKQDDLLTEVRKVKKDWKVGSVIYDKKKQIEYLTQLIQMIQSVEDDKSKDNFRYINEIENFMAYLFCMFKQKNHACENEYRIVLDDMFDETKYRIRNGLFLPYLIIKFAGNIPIKNITIGPKISKDIYAIGLNEYLSSIYRDNILVKSSEIRLN
jgi:hypothetical protein